MVCSLHRGIRGLDILSHDSHSQADICQKKPVGLQLQPWRGWVAYIALFGIDVETGGGHGRLPARALAGPDSHSGEGKTAAVQALGHRGGGGSSPSKVR